ncbi:MAG: hypothetical protein IH840_05865 [Candidatus Heimdallarchaeota archaeon]|nr:hypothetical protein [Candidatus Heimdallarchaeota archaeon]
MSDTQSSDPTSTTTIASSTGQTDPTTTDTGSQAPSTTLEDDPTSSQDENKISSEEGNQTDSTSLAPQLFQYQDLRQSSQSSSWGSW